MGRANGALTSGFGKLAKLRGDQVRCLREHFEELEREQLRKEATFSTSQPAASRQKDIEPDAVRTEFRRDYTRIIHSRAFRRLRHKTQVFVDPSNDHICTRLEHSMYVCSISRTIARALDLNTELVEAIAVGHDLGHAPFGHKGERKLSELANEKGLSFSHELHSLRVVDQLDSPYQDYVGLNLTFAVRDGIACHYGEGFERRLTPNVAKDPRSLPDMQRTEMPATLEGCVVRMADKVAYLGRDLEDALMTGIVTEADIPDSVRSRLGVDNRSIINTLVQDIIESSKGKVHIEVGDAAHKALEDFNGFNVKRIYTNTRVTEAFGQIDKAMEMMYHQVADLVGEAKSHDADDEGPWDDDKADCLGALWIFLKEDVRDWREEEPARLALDFLAGMTDSYFVESFMQLFLPTSSF